MESNNLSQWNNNNDDDDNDNNKINKEDMKLGRRDDQRTRGSWSREMRDTYDQGTLGICMKIPKNIN